MSKFALKESVDNSRVRAIQSKIEESGNLIESIVNNLVATHCKPLDEYIAYVRDVLADTDNPPTDLELDDFALNIPTLIYFTGEAQESLGIKEDLAKAFKQELYNEVYDKASGTIADKTAVAELAVLHEQLVHTAYQRAYKKVKLRMESANEILQSVKKVITRRITEYEISRVDPQRIGGR